MGRGETGGFETGHRAFALEAVEEELLALLPQLETLTPTIRNGLSHCLHP